MEMPEERSGSEERIEEVQLNEEAFLYAPVKKDILIGLINDEKKKFPLYRRTPSSLKTVEAMLNNIKSDNLSPDDQLKLYQCIARSKPKLEHLEGKMIAAFRRDFKTYFPGYEDLEISRYRSSINELLAAGSIKSGTTFKEVLKKNPEALFQTIDDIKNDSRLEKKEMLMWLCNVQDPNSVRMAMDYLSRYDENYDNDKSSISNKRVQILSKIDPSKINVSNKSVLFEALDTLASSCRSISDLSPEFIEKILTGEYSLNHIAKYLFDNPNSIPIIYAALPKEKWTIHNLETMLNRNNGVLLSEEAEKRIWGKIPTGKFSDSDFEEFKKQRFTRKAHLNGLEKYLNNKAENTISSEVSALIQKYESKRWFWERLFFKLPEPIVKAKEILNSGTGYYKNLSGQQQIELLQCLNGATKIDKRSSDVLQKFELHLKQMYMGDNGENYHNINTVLTMVKEGIIGTSKQFEVATQEATRWIAECYELFIKNNMQKDIADKAWSVIFNHSDPDSIAQAISLLAKRNALNLKNLNILESSANPLLIANASIAFHDQSTQNGMEVKTLGEQLFDVSKMFSSFAKQSDTGHAEKGSNIELITDIGDAMKVLTITNSLTSRKDSKKLFSYLMEVKDFEKLEKLLKNHGVLTLIVRIMERKMFKEIPLDLFGEEVKIDVFLENIKKSPLFSEIRKACNFDLEKLNNKTFERLLKIDFDILFGEEGIKSFWKKIGEGVCTEDDFYRILDKVEYGQGSRHLNSSSLKWEKESYLAGLVKEFLAKKKESQPQQERKPDIQSTPSSSTATTSTPMWSSSKGKEEAQKDDKRPPSPSAGKK